MAHNNPTYIKLSHAAHDALGTLLELIPPERKAEADAAQVVLSEALAVFWSAQSTLREIGWQLHHFDKEADARALNIEKINSSSA